VFEEKPGSSLERAVLEETWKKHFGVSELQMETSYNLWTYDEGIKRTSP
jgi:hypothetical protein